MSRKDAVTNWASLTEAQRKIVARKIGGAALDFDRRATRFGRGFDAVRWPFNVQRRPAFVETQGEDKQSTIYQRLQLTNLQRDMLRNSPTRVAQDQQLRVHVVGSVGGKLYASFPEGYAAAAEQVTRYFNKIWFPKAEFTFRKNFNWLLKTCLTSMDTNGNVILVFDDGILTGGNGTGRIRGFEGDEIANVNETEFQKHFPKSCFQSLGFVYNESGMHCGAFVSTKCRGRGSFDKGDYITLKCDPFDDVTPINWVTLGEMRRFNQGRAISPLTAALTCLIDLYEISSSEAQAAKLNAQLVGQILQDASAEPEQGPAIFEDDDGEHAEALPETQEFSTKELTSIGAHFDQMPEGLKIDLLDTKRPNPNMPAYIEFLTGLVGGARGLARVYSTLKAQTSYTAFRGEQVMSEPSFEEARQDLERDVCDWAARCVISRAVKLGIITEALPDDWQYMIAWNWPQMLEVSEKDAQTALSLKLKNGVTSLTRELGPGEVEKVIAEQAREKAAFDAAGLIYPSEVTIKGVLKDEVTDNNETTQTKGEENAE